MIKVKIGEKFLQNYTLMKIRKTFPTMLSKG